MAKAIVRLFVFGLRLYIMQHLQCPGGAMQGCGMDVRAEEFCPIQRKMFQGPLRWKLNNLSPHTSFTLCIDPNKLQFLYFFFFSSFFLTAPLVC